MPKNVETEPFSNQSKLSESMYSNQDSNNVTPRKKNSDDEILRTHSVIQMQQEDAIINGQHVTVKKAKKMIKFETKGQRKKFVQVVFSIVISMLVINMFAGALPFLYPPIKHFFNKHFWIIYVASAIFTVIYILIVCIRPLRQKTPYNWITVVVFTLVSSFFIVCLCSTYNLKTVSIALLATVVSTIVVILYATFTKTDFTTCYALLFGLTALTCIFGIVVLISQFFLPPHTFEIMHLVYSCIGAVVCLIYLIFDIQLIMGRKKNAIAPDEYVLGAILVFTDIFVIFFYITGIVKGFRAENV